MDDSMKYGGKTWQTISALPPRALSKGEFVDELFYAEANRVLFKRQEPSSKEKLVHLEEMYRSLRPHLISAPRDVVYDMSDVLTRALEKDLDYIISRKDRLLSIIQSKRFSLSRLHHMLCFIERENS